MTAPPSRLGAVLARYPDFRRLFTGYSVSLLGSSVTTVALPLTAVVYLRASAVQMGLLGAAMWLPHLVLGLPAGVWVDRAPYRRVLVLADLAQALVIGAIPVLAALGALHMWQLYIAVILSGTGSLFEAIAAQSFTPVLVPREHLLSANSALMLSYATVTTTGPALGGVLVSLLTAPVAVAADAVSFAAAALCKARIRARGRAIAPAGRPERHLRANIVAGLRAVFGHPVVRALTLAATIGALAGQMQAVILVLYLVRGLGLPPVLVGVVVAAGGAAGIPARCAPRASPGAPAPAGRSSPGCSWPRPPGWCSRPRPGRSRSPWPCWCRPNCCAAPGRRCTASTSRPSASR